MNIGLNAGDIKRIVWSFIGGALAYASAVALNWVPGQAFDLQTFRIGVIAAGVSALKNGLLADGNKAK